MNIGIYAAVITLVLMTVWVAVTLVVGLFHPVCCY